ncbi:MAG: DUF1523 family protein [Rhodobacteraceae bacterium]|nr:DUF1523 family protein [Paracoccaceae bacterium]
MGYVKWTFIILFWTVVAGFFHYTLPQKDIVYVTGVEIKREDFGENMLFWASPDTGAGTVSTSRDVRFVDTVKASDGRVMVYRNEDTGWGWPPYFKLDSSNLQAEMRNFISNRNDPQWVIIRHYGWRNEYMSIYPNAVGVWLVDSPDASKGIPWLNISVLTVFFALVWAVWVRWRRFRKARIDPMLDNVSDSFDAASDSVAEKRGRLKRWLDSWRS